MSWLSSHARSIEALAACVTACVALAALIGVKFQLDAADARDRAQAARDAYRGHLALSVANPRFAAPDDVCAVLASPDAGSYYAFVDHLLYSAELTLDTDDGWAGVILTNLEPHAPYLCATDAVGVTEDVAALLAHFSATSCQTVQLCQ